VIESLEQTKDAIRFKSPKTNKARVIALPAFALEELRQLSYRRRKSCFALACANLATP
jgi:hypothetical protein